MLNRWQRTIVDLRGNVVPYAQLQVRVEATQAAAEIYRDSAGTEVIPNGIVTANAQGYAFFYAPAGLYRITSAEPVIDWRDVNIGSAEALLRSNNLDDLSSASDARSNLGLGTAATRDVGTEPNEIPTNDDLGSAAFISIDDLQWLGTPIGGYITPFSPPPKDDPRFRYILCTAGESGSGGYNEGVLTGETVSGTEPLIVASATVSLAGSPLNGVSIPLINTEGRFVGAGAIAALEDDSFQGSWPLRAGGNIVDSIHPKGTTNNATTVAMGDAAQQGTSFNKAQPVTDGVNGTPRVSNKTQPRTHRMIHYRRIL